MAKQKMGLVDRIILGTPKSEEYARSKLPTNRWSLFFDIFKGRFFKIILINLLTLLFFIPLFAVLFFHAVSLSSMGQSVPFSQCFGLGYQSLYNFVGYPESISLSVNLSTLIFLPVASLGVGLGLAGCAYVMRNMVWTEGIFVANDFWQGIKQNYKHLLLTSFIYSAFLYFAIISVTLLGQLQVTGQMASWLTIVLKSVIIVFMAFLSIMVLHMITMTVTYDLKYKHVIKNAFLMTVAMPFHNVFFAIMAALPVALIFIGGIFSTLGYAFTILFGVSYALLVWTDFCQWGYDRYINDRVPGAQKNRGIYPKNNNSNSKALEQYRQQLVSLGPSDLSSRPIKPITDEELQLDELPVSFNRDDIKRLNESRQAIYDDNEKYVEEHKNDQRYLDYKKEYEAEKTEVVTEDAEKAKRIEKAKKELARRNDKYKNPKKKKRK